MFSCNGFGQILSHKVTGVKRTACHHFRNLLKAPYITFNFPQKLNIFKLPQLFHEQLW